MLARALPFPLVLAALACDLAGSHGLALVVLFGAVPAAFAFALSCYGDALEARSGGVRPLVATAGLLLLLLSAALRSPAVVGGVPQLAVSSLVLCLLLYSGQGLAFLLSVKPRPRVEPRIAAAEETAETESLAA